MTQKQPRNHSKLIAFVVVILAIVLLVGQRVAFQGHTIPQDEMFPSIPAGSLVVAYEWSYSNADEVERGDVVILEAENDGETYDFIGRVIGLPGEPIAVEGGALSVDGQLVEREPLGSRKDCDLYRERFESASYVIAMCDVFADSDEFDVTLEDGEFFVMGDNRLQAMDSRELGPISFEQIQAKVVTGPLHVGK